MAKTQIQPAEVETIELAAQMDALWEPITDWSRARRRAIAGLVEQRTRFKASGIPYRVGGDASDRTRGHRAADRLEEGGDVVFFRERGKRIGWKLTPAAYWRARYWALLSGEVELVRAMTALLENESRGCVVGGSGYCPEYCLTGWWDDTSRRTRDRVAHVREIVQPGLSLGLLNSWSDTLNGIYYQVTESGHRHLDGWKRPSFGEPAYTKEVAKISDQLRGVYNAALRDARSSIAALQGEDNHCVIPWSAGIIPSRKLAAPPILDSEGNLVREATT